MAATRCPHLVTIFCILYHQVVLVSADCPNVTSSCACRSSQSGISIHCRFLDGDIGNGTRLLTGQSIPTQLNKVDLSSNGLQGIPNEFFKGIQSVSDLDLNNNSFAVIPKALEEFQEIYNLNLSGNSIKSLDMANLLQLNITMSVDISFNDMQQIMAISDVDSSRKLTRIRVLNLSHNALQGIKSDIFRGFEQSLVQLNLNKNNLSEIDSSAFKNVPDLRVLSLSENPGLKKMDIDLPEHVVSLDLKNCSLQTVNDCSFRNTIDLEYLDLSGNNLTCDCHVIWLYELYEERNSMNNVINFVPLVPWTCTDEDGNLHKISKEMGATYCKTHKGTLREPKHCIEELIIIEKPSEQPKLSIELTEETEALVLEWLYGANKTEVYAFKVIVKNTGTNSLEYESPLLHSDVKKFSVPTPDSGQYEVCVQVLLNASQVADEKCKEFSLADLKVVIGVLAGTIFLIPCVMAIVYIIYRDKQIQKSVAYGILEDKEKNIEGPLDKPQNVKQQKDVEGTIHVPGLASDVTRTKLSTISEKSMENKANEMEKSLSPQLLEKPASNPKLNGTNGTAQTKDENVTPSAYDNPSFAQESPDGENLQETHESESESTGSSSENTRDNSQTENSLYSVKL